MADQPRWYYRVIAQLVALEISAAVEKKAASIGIQDGILVGLPEVKNRERKHAPELRFEKKVTA